MAKQPKKPPKHVEALIKKHTDAQVDRAVARWVRGIRDVICRNNDQHGGGTRGSRR